MGVVGWQLESRILIPSEARSLLGTAVVVVPRPHFPSDMGPGGPTSLEV